MQTLEQVPVTCIWGRQEGVGGAARTERTAPPSRRARAGINPAPTFVIARNAQLRQGGRESPLRLSGRRGYLPRGRAPSHMRDWTSPTQPLSSQYSYYCSIHWSEEQRKDEHPDPYQCCDQDEMPPASDGPPRINCHADEGGREEGETHHGGGKDKRKSAFHANIMHNCPEAGPKDHAGYKHENCATQEIENNHVHFRSSESHASRITT